jgi:hypothetical protein
MTLVETVKTVKVFILVTTICDNKKYTAIHTFNDASCWPCLSQSLFADFI